jgi:TolA-binding protein
MMLLEITDSTLVAPGVSLGAFAGLLALAAREYRNARREDVENERSRRIAAEAREKESGESNSVKLDELSKRVRSLESKIDDMRTENDDRINEMRVTHETELLEERGKNFGLRKLLRENGVTIPEELGPK